MDRSLALQRAVVLSSFVSLASLSLLPLALQGGCTEPAPNLPGPPPTPTCTDGVKNGDETAQDCGGSCKACDVGLSCKADTDCRSQRCDTGVCSVPPSCTDGKKNGAETGKDCGGPCARCVDGEGCGGADDCVSQVCQQSLCVAPGCVDGKKNGNETDVDCGGSCGKCDGDKACGGPADCLSNACVSARCLPPAVITSVTPDQGPSTGGTQLEIRGDKLLSGGDVPKVFIDGIEVPTGDVVAQSAMLLKVKTPAAPGRFGPVSIKVQDANGRQGEVGMKFRYYLGSLGFADQLPSLIDSTPESVAAADFDGDGVLDLATAHALASKGVSVALGLKDGSFSSPIHLDADTRPGAVVTADFDGDKKADLAVANVGSNSVTIYLGLGTGYFKARVPYGVGASPGGLALGDYNGDNKIDLAVANRGGTVSVLLGNGDGTFKTPALAYSTAGQAYGIAAGLLNNDNKLDLVVSNRDKSNISVLLGNGDGSFQSPKNQDVATSPWPIAVADLDRNGKADLVVGSAGPAGTPSGDVQVLMGLGDGTFEAPRLYPCGAIPQSITAVDLDLDGVLDVAVAVNSATDPLVSVLRGVGDGKLEMPRKKRAGLSPYHLVGGDFNADGKPDLVAVDRSFGNALVFLNSSL